MRTSFRLLLVAVLGLAGCQPAVSAVPLAGTVWQLSELDGKAIDRKVRPTLQLDEKAKRASGLAGVNRFSGSFTLSDSALSFGELAMTRMAGSPELMALEGRYTKALGAVTAWRIKDGALELLIGEKPIARYTAAPAP